SRCQIWPEASRQLRPRRQVRADRRHHRNRGQFAACPGHRPARGQSGGRRYGAGRADRSHQRKGCAGLCTRRAMAPRIQGRQQCVLDEALPGVRRGMPQPRADARRRETMNARASHLMGVDLGASNLKATIIRSDGSLAGEASHSLDTQIPHPGWSEQNPADWYAAFCKAVPNAIANAGIQASDIAAIGFSAGTHIPLLTDANDEVIRPAILCADKRSIAGSRELHEPHEKMIIRTSLNRANPTWALAVLA